MKIDTCASCGGDAIIVKQDRKWIVENAFALHITVNCEKKCVPDFKGSKLDIVTEEWNMVQAQVRKNVAR